MSCLPYHPHVCGSLVQAWMVHLKEPEARWYDFLDGSTKPGIRRWRMWRIHKKSQPQTFPFFVAYRFFVCGMNLLLIVVVGSRVSYAFWEVLGEASRDPGLKLTVDILHHVYEILERMWEFDGICENLMEYVVYVMRLCLYICVSLHVIYLYYILYPMNCQCMLITYSH